MSLFTLYCFIILTGIALSYSHFGEGTGHIWLNDVNCTGSESRLLDCRYNIAEGNCYHFEDSSVQCMESHRKFMY